MHEEELMLEAVLRRLRPPQPNVPGPTRNGRSRVQLLLTITFFVILTSFLTILSLAFVWTIFHMPALPSEAFGLRIFDRNNQLFEVMLEDHEICPVPLSSISKNVQEAVITSEDRAFYHHHGLDPFGVVRAVAADIKAGKALQGGSTITEQLIKNLYYSHEKRSARVKLQEILMAVTLDLRYPKEKILEAYLNYVYFGKGAYGIERAAERYFGKHASQLTIAESAYLAGLVNAPSELSSPEHLSDALDRQKQILIDMAKLDYVTDSQSKQAIKEKLTFKGHENAHEEAAYYLDHVKTDLQALLPNRDLWISGLQVYTNLDPVAQSLAQRELTTGIKRSPIGVSQGALVTISVADGAVLAMSGGAGSFEASPWNRALSPHTAGSAFKPFVYLTGILSGALRPETTLYDSPLTIRIPDDKKAYSPKDFDGLFMGPLSVRTALARSRNVCAVRAAQLVGINPIIETARKAGITSKLEPTLALALGSSAVSPLEMAGAYATFARQGIYVQPSFIRQVKDANGKILFQQATSAKPVFPAEPVAELVDMMQDVVTKGTGRVAALPDREVAGKTGTADGARDVWFIGFTPDTVTAIWAGNDGDKPIAGSAVTGGSVAATIWHSYMSKFYDTHTIVAQAFPEPAHAFLDDNAVAAIRASQPQPGTPITVADSMPRVAPDFHTYKSEEKKGRGGIGRFLHKIFSLF